MNTFPAPYQWYVNHKDEIKKWLLFSCAVGYESHEAGNCGLHVHISRSGYKSEVHLMKMLYLQELMFDYLHKFSRRQDKNCRWCKTFGLDGTVHEFYQKARRIQEDLSCDDCDTSHPSKYFHFNMRNRDTIEIRLFRGTLAFETWFSCLQMVKSLLDFSNDAPVEWVQNATAEEAWEKFSSCIKVSEYPELINNLIRKKLIRKDIVGINFNVFDLNSHISK